MGIRENRAALLSAAAGWDGVAAELEAANTDLWSACTQGWAFGWFADRAEIPEEHNRFVSDMLDALLKGRANATQIAEALRDTAKDFGATDTNVADMFHNPDGTPA